jgi:hypothetical protein
VTIHGDYFSALRRSGKTSERVMSDQLKGCIETFSQKKWITPAGFLSSIWVPVQDLDMHEEVEIQINEIAGVFTYQSPGVRNRTLMRPLSDIAFFSFNTDVWFDTLVDLFEIESSKTASSRQLIENHLWHLGDLRIGNTNHQAPLYLAMRLEHCAADWKRALEDRRRDPRGIVLVDKFDDNMVLANGHQVCWIESLLKQNHSHVSVRRDMLDRMLGFDGVPPATDSLWFNDSTGELKLPHMEKSKTFKGKQLAVIRAFWRVRGDKFPALKWEVVIEQTGCGKDPGSTFGNDKWHIYLENVDPGAGMYELRIKS